MRISVYAFVYACVLLVAVALAAPHVSEEFSATVKLSLHHKSIGHNVTGHGLWASSLSGGRSIERFLFGPQGHPYNEFRLQRYDLATAYEEVHGSSCLVTPLEGVMAPVWGWLALANETTTSSGKHYTLAMGYATVSLYLNEKGVPRLYIVDGPGRTATFEFLLWTDVTPGAGVFEVPKHCPTTSPAPSGPSLVGCIGRSTIIGRAQDWVNRHVPYSQSGNYEGYRTDCSGYVSMAWEAARPGYSCSTLPQVSHPISRGQLQPGDVLLCRTEHVVIFGGWASSTHYVAFEETRPGEGTVRRVTPYPYWYNTGCFLPYRYNAVC